MRIGSVSALILAAFALAACEGSPTTGSSASSASLALCGLSCPDPTDDNTNDSDGDGVDDGADGDDSSTDGGNTTDLSPTNADVTIALQNSNLQQPTSGTSLSQLLNNPLSGPPATQRIVIDTNTSSNGSWPTPVTMNEYLPGSTLPDPTGNGNGGSVTYNEYRAISNTPGQERDEELQVWAWNDSYATQYRNASGGGEASQQAWSFGGNKTALASMPVGGSANYTGRFVATAKSTNWIKPSGADIDPNALWRVQGASTVDANFATASVTGTLTPETWTSFQSGVSGWYTWNVGTVGTVAEPDYSIYNTEVALAGTITGNTYAGTATLDGNFVSGDNPMYGGFFGAGASETTGIFNVYGVDPDPIGGSAGINDDHRGFLTINGAFNGN
ncbi:MAG: transferrin-binding protein-like solute binding protein [Hyphomicrobiales bacterium]|nr:transferrin-binding protein-like solute binding protein [Hyphomicrobiales bacterium]